MAEPVDPSDDWDVTRGCARTISIEAYDPEADTHDGGTTCTGCRTGRRVEVVPVEGGEVRVTHATWTFLAEAFAQRPPLRSLIVDGSESWAIDSYRSDPRDAVHTCECTLT